jgi:hypothetical protein
MPEDAALCKFQFNFNAYSEQSRLRSFRLPDSAGTTCRVVSMPLDGFMGGPGEIDIDVRLSLPSASY